MNNSNPGLIRSLKRIEKNGIIGKKGDLRVQSLSFFLSVIALIVSGSSIYFQFFHEDFDLNASLLNAEVYEDSLNLSLIYHNKGNQDATIISSRIFFYSDSNRANPKNHFYFVSNKIEPYILSPGKQIFINLKQKVYFDEVVYSKYNLSREDTIRVNLGIQFLNDNSLQSEREIECGWITLDSLNNIEYWLLNYQRIKLESDEYFIRGYKRPKQ
jgi:hypothetical protein